MLQMNVADGVHRIEDAHTNWYLIEDDERLTIVDAGVPRSWASLQEALNELGRKPLVFGTLEFRFMGDPKGGPRVLTGHDNGIITVNIEDTPEDLRKRMQGMRLTLPILFDKHSEEAYNIKFGVDVGPTNYILDENGKVVFRMAAFSEKQLRRALRKMGIQ